MELSHLAAGPEFDLIRSFLADAPPLHPTVRVGPGDDCTIVGSIAISTDASIEGVHFRREWISAEEIGWRSAAAALSDLAAVAAEPIGVMVSLAVPEHDRPGFARDVMRGVVKCVASVGGCLLGGDTTAAPTVMIDITVVGRAPHPVLRSHARIGDELWVTGKLGGPAAAVAALGAGAEPNPTARARFANPVPRVREARWLQRHTQVHAMIDLSDGLFGDVAHIAAASACGIVIETAAVPIDEGAGATMAHAVAGGEDYEICLVAGPGAMEHVKEQFEREFQLALTRIGFVQSGEGVHELLSDGTVQPATLRGYQHFREQG